jgi:hypothetical protein
VRREHERAELSCVDVVYRILYLGNIVKDGGFGKFLHRRVPAA